MTQTLERRGPPPPLPLPWVQRILAKLAVRYGTVFTSRWTGVKDTDLWADWAQVLAGYDANPDAIAYALDHLPADFPPTASAFRELCRAAPLPEVKALPAPEPDPAVAAAALAGLSKPAIAHDAKGWARALAEREFNGAALTLSQRSMWRQAFSLPPSATARQFLQPHAA